MIKPLTARASALKHEVHDIRNIQFSRHDPACRKQKKASLFKRPSFLATTAGLLGLISTAQISAPNSPGEFTIHPGKRAEARGGRNNNSGSRAKFLFRARKGGKMETRERKRGREGGGILISQNHNKNCRRGGLEPAGKSLFHVQIFRPRSSTRVLSRGRFRVAEPRRHFVVPVNTYVRKYASVDVGRHRLEALNWATVRRPRG